MIPKDTLEAEGYEFVRMQEDEDDVIIVKNLDSNLLELFQRADYYAGWSIFYDGIEYEFVC